MPTFYIRRNSEDVVPLLYELLKARYGEQHWWPGDGPFEIAVGAILTQATAWTNAERAIANLKAAGQLSAVAIHQLETARLAALIRPSGYYNVKANRLKRFVALLVERYDGCLERLFQLATPALRAELLAVRGIGAETADAIALYAANRPLFVIDAYTTRLCIRLGLVTGEASYKQLQALFEANLPRSAALYNECHALIVRHARSHCHKQPRCDGCPLLEICRHAGAGKS